MKEQTEKLVAKAKKQKIVNEVTLKSVGRVEAASTNGKCRTKESIEEENPKAKKARKAMKSKGKKTIDSDREDFAPGEESEDNVLELDSMSSDQEFEENRSKKTSKAAAKKPAKTSKTEQPGVESSGSNQTVVIPPKALIVDMNGLFCSGCSSNDLCSYLEKHIDEASYANKNISVLIISSNPGHRRVSKSFMNMLLFLYLKEKKLEKNVRIEKASKRAFKLVDKISYVQLLSEKAALSACYYNAHQDICFSIRLLLCISVI